MYEVLAQVAPAAGVHVRVTVAGDLYQPFVPRVPVVLAVVVTVPL